jgi:ethanolamine transporter EutH
MGDSFEILAQAVGDNSLNDTLTVASETQIIISKIVITETAGGTPTYSVSIAKAGATNADKQYLAKDVALTARQRVVLGEGITLDETDVVRFDGSTSAVTIQIFGVNITNN